PPPTPPSPDRDAGGGRARPAPLPGRLGDERRGASARAEAQRHADGIVWPDSLAELALKQAQLAHWRGEPDKAREHLASVQELLGRTEMVSSVRAKIMDLYGYLTDDVEQARAHRRQAFEAAMENMYPPTIAESLVGIADVALREGRYEQAARLIAASDAVRGTPDRSLPDAARIAEEARGHLGETAFAEATLDGRRRDLRELAEITLTR
ncbi:AfsR/SARP family transcriptional regulator, partial [Nonomuraea sp. NPDC001699]